MQVESIERPLFSIVNPFLKVFVKTFDVDCDRDGNLLTNALKHFLDQPVPLCEQCATLNRRLVLPFFRVAARLMRTKPEFMRNVFVDQPQSETWLRGFVLMMKGIAKYGIRIPFVPAGPFNVVWNFTYTCNLKCKHCYEEAGFSRPELTTDQAFRTVDALARIGHVGLPSLAFSGGEPLLRKDFFEVAAYAKTKIPFISLATNGTLLTKKNVAKLKEVGVAYVEISLDGASEAVHERFRRVPGCYAKTIRGIQNCIDANLATCIATTAHQENIDEIPRIIELAEQLGVRFMHFNYVPTGRAKEHMNLDLRPKERLSLLTLIGRKILDLYMTAKAEEQRRGESNTSTDLFFSTCPQFASVVKHLSNEKGENFTVSAHYAAQKGVENLANFLGGCGAGRLYIGLEPNGDIKPCVFFPSSVDTILGNILKDDFEMLWDTNAVLWRLRSRENLVSYRIDGQTIGCGTCEDKYICGGCRARSYGYFNRCLNEPDIGCIDNEPLWTKIKELTR